MNDDDFWDVNLDRKTKRDSVLDLNRHDHAVIYIKRWAAATKDLNHDYDPLVIELGTKEDHLRVARQIFLYCDPRPPLNLERH